MVRVAARGGARFPRGPGEARGGDHAAYAGAVFRDANNPSGVILSAAELAVIGDLARRHSLWVVADEVYADWRRAAEFRAWPRNCPTKW